jgi:hypothetical protein
MPIAIRYFGFLTRKKTERVALPERYFLPFNKRRFLMGKSELFFESIAFHFFQSFD